MGEANKYRERFFLKHPICCFCGGQVRAVEIEHIPPRFMFLSKHRPKGFEFPTCEPCNRASRKTDTVVSFLAKFGSLKNLSESYQSDFDTALKGLFHNCPETFDEIYHGRQGNRKAERKFREKYGQDAAIVSLGPKQKEHLNLFGLKLTLATYYFLTDRVATQRARISVSIHTSQNLIEDTAPRELNFLGYFDTMKQGTWQVPEQFLYRFGFTEDKKSGVFQFLLHENLLLSTFIFDEAHERLSSMDDLMTIGDLRPVTEKTILSLPTMSASFQLTN